MNPLELINIIKVDFDYSCTFDNNYTNEQSKEFFATTCEYIEKLKYVRHSEKHTEKIINELFEKSNSIKWLETYWEHLKFRFITPWLVAALEEDKSYYYAKIQLNIQRSRQFHWNNIDGVIPEISKVELFEILEKEKTIEKIQNISIPEKDASKTISVERNQENTNNSPQYNGVDFSIILKKIKFDKDEKTKKEANRYLEELSDNDNFKNANAKEFSAVALIIYKTGWISNTKTFSEWLAIFSEAFDKKKPTYKVNQIENETKTMKIKIPFLDKLPKTT
jgi:hypothetical protein